MGQNFDIIDDIARRFVEVLIELNPKDGQDRLKKMIDTNQELINLLGGSIEDNIDYRNRIIYYLGEKNIASASNVLWLLGLAKINNISMTDFLFEDNNYDDEKNNQNAKYLYGLLYAKQIVEEEQVRAATIFFTNGARASGSTSSSSNATSLPISAPISASVVVDPLPTTFELNKYFQAWYQEVQLGNIDNLKMLINNSGLTAAQVAQVINFLPIGPREYDTVGNSLFLQALEDENLDMAELLFNHGGDICVAKPDGINAIHMLAMVHPDSDLIPEGLYRKTLSEDAANKKIAKVRSLLQKLQQSDFNKFNRLINAPRIYSMYEQQHIGTGVPLLKVIAYCDDPKYIADMVKAWQQVGATIKPDQLHTIWPKCMGKSEAYLAKIEELFSGCFDFGQLIKPYKGENAFEYVIDRADYSMLNYLIKRHKVSVDTEANLKKSIMVAHKKKFLDLFKDNFLSCFNDSCLMDLGDEGITANLRNFNQRAEKQFIENIGLMAFHQQPDFYDPSLQQELISWLEERQMPRIRNIITTDAANQIELVAKEFIKRVTYSSGSSNRCINRLRLTT